MGRSRFSFGVFAGGDDRKLLPAAIAVGANPPGTVFTIKVGAAIDDSALVPSLFPAPTRSQTLVSIGQSRDLEAPLAVPTPVIAPLTLIDRQQRPTIQIGTDRNNALTGTDFGDRIEGRGGRDTVIGLRGADVLSGQDGDDSLDGGEADDTLFGGAGNDTLDGGLGRDRLAGGASDDTYIVDNGGDRIVEADAGGFDQVVSVVSYALSDEVEVLLLQGGGNLRGIGSRDDNRIVGTVGNNVLEGGDGADTLEGGLGRDTLSGGKGDDRLLGGAGPDLITCGKGDDTFVYGAVGDSPAGRNTRDVIRDFNAAEGDRLDLTGLNLDPGDLSFARGILSADVDGNGTVDVQIELQGVGSLPAGAILL
jgi:Ca2+-binding RTX toxin-like protein